MQERSMRRADARELILVLEASTDNASVALIVDDVVASEIRVASRDPRTGARTEGLMPAIAQCLLNANAEPKQLTAIVCSNGPGGFTSLRSAAAIAKGMCLALHIPLYAVSVMDLLIAGASLPAGWYLAALDAGRGEHYASVVRVMDDGLPKIGPIQLMPRSQLEENAREMHATLVGPHLQIDVVPQASAAFPIIDKILGGDPVDVDQWQPAYGRLAEAQVKWEAAHGRPLPS